MVAILSLGRSANSPKLKPSSPEPEISQEKKVIAMTAVGLAPSVTSVMVV